MTTRSPESEIDRRRSAKAILERAYAQPTGQNLPHEFLAMLAELDRAKR